MAIKQGNDFNINSQNNMNDNNPIVYSMHNNEKNPMTNLPFDVSKDLSFYSKIFVAISFDSFRNVNYCDKFISSPDFLIYGELPDGDKKLLFTCSKHEQCCKLCDNCIIPFCLCDLVCCNSIIFQLDYKRNNRTFYTQGLNLQRGCHFCKCDFCFSKCSCCCKFSFLNLRENIEPDNPDFNVGIKKGSTMKGGCCCSDILVFYMTPEGAKGPTIRLPCCKGFNCCHCTDVEIDIEDDNGVKIGNIHVPYGCCSENVKGMCCYVPRLHYEINIPQNMPSEQKFQIIADVIHFNF